MSVHHRFKKGKRVFITLRDGTKIIDKYVSSNSSKIILENGSYRWNEIRCTDIYIPKIYNKV